MNSIGFIWNEEDPIPFFGGHFLGDGSWSYWIESFTWFILIFLLFFFSIVGVPFPSMFS